MPILLALLFTLLSLQSAAQGFEVLEEVPIPYRSFTQGYEFDGKHFYISSGLYKQSFIAIETPATQSYRRRSLPAKVFAEGLTRFQGSLYVLTWKAGQALVFDEKTLAPKQHLTYQGEGWGLANNGQSLLMSNGSNTIQFRTPKNFELEKTVSITHKNKPLANINELEFAQGALWANVWKSDTIYRIDLETGQTLDSWDLSSLKTGLNLSHADAVLNGIAYDDANKAFWVTGKLWPKRFLIRFNTTKALDNRHAKTAH